MANRLWVILSVIVLLFGAVSLVPLGFFSPSTKPQRDESDLGFIGRAFEEYSQETRSLPSDEEGFTPLVKKGLLRDWPVDPWGERYEYTRLGHDADGATIRYGGRTKMIFSYFEARPDTGKSPTK